MRERASFINIELWSKLIKNEKREGECESWIYVRKRRREGRDARVMIDWWRDAGCSEQ